MSSWWRRSESNRLAAGAGRCTCPHAPPMMLLILTLAGCNGTLPPVPRETLVPIAVPCLDKLPDQPAFLADSDLAKLDDFRFVIELRRDQLELRGHVEILTATLRACLK